MLRSLFLVFICHCCFSSLLADEESFSPPDEPFVSSLVKTQNLLSTVVDSVSTISGEWLHSDTDFVVLGPEPLVLNRYYTGDHAHNDRLGYNWYFNHLHPLIVDLKEKKIDHARAQARLHQSSGIATIHEVTASQKEVEKNIITLPLSRTQGLTNCRSEISAKTNLHNTVIQMDFKGGHCAAISGSGCLTYYEFSHRQHLHEWKQGSIGVGYYKGHVLNHYRPIYERKPNGNTLHFGRGIISATNDSNTQVYGTIQFQNEELKVLKVKASDGKIATYKFNIYDHPVQTTSSRVQGFKKHRFCLVEANFSHKPTEIYEYTQQPPHSIKDHPENPLLKAKRRPDNRFQEVEYYTKGHNQLEMSTENRRNVRDIKLDGDDFRIHRVKVIKAPVGHDSTPIITHRFIYETDPGYKSVKKTDHDFSGKTKVLDAYLRKTIYEYNVEHRPTKIKRFDSNDQLYDEECYTWDDLHSYPNEIHKEKRSYHNTAIQSSTLPSLSSSIEPSIDSYLPDFFKSSRKEQISKILKLCLKAKWLQTGGAGNLLGKYVKDSSGQILYAHFFKYDDKGNILCDRLYGNLRGIHPQHIELDLHDTPKQNGCEYYEKRFTYLDNEFNLLKTEEEDNGKGIIYEYYPNTDLIAAKYVTENSFIKLRQFFYYDANATLIKLIKDDGKGMGVDNLVDLSERHISYIHPRQTAPFGLPEWIEHKYLDHATNTEKLLKKIYYHYSQEGYLVQQDHFDANHQFCYSLFWEYDAHGNVTKEVNALGHTIIKTYDSNDNLYCEIGPRAGDYKEYTYDFSNRLIGIKQEADGKTWTIHYRYDLVGNRIAEIDRYGNETQYEYDAFNRLTHILYPAIAGQATRPEKKTEYNCLDHVTSETNALGNVTTKTYNVRGNPTSILHPDGQLERFEYHLDGTSAKKIASNGTNTIYTYDCFGRLLNEVVYSAEGKYLYETRNTYNSLHKISSTDAMGVTTYFDYDAAGRIIKTTCLDKVELYEYDSLGRQIKKKELFDHHKMKVSCTDYDFLDQIIEERIEDENGQILKKVSYHYDVLGNRTHVIEETAAGPSQHVTLYNIDKKPILTIDPEGNQTHITYDVVQNTLGQHVMQMTASDPLGRQTIITYDALEHPVNIKRKDINGVLLANQDLFYDGEGHVIRLIDHVIVHGEEKRQIETLFEYQEMGQLSCLIQAHGLPEQHITRTKYNAFGQKESVTKNDGNILFYTYDPLGRLLTYSSSDHSFAYHYDYNARHQILRVEDMVQQAVSQFEYDARGRLLTEILANGLPIHYEYDCLDRVIRLILPNANDVIYTYDALNLKRVDRLKQQNLLYTHRYDQFDLAGLNLKSTSIHQQEIRYTYDRHKRPLMMENDFFKQSQLQYDRGGRLLSYRLQDSIGAIRNTFAYDDLDHLISEAADQTKNTYICDSLHNRLMKNQASHLSNALHQLIHNGECSFSYDHAGNLKSQEKNQEMTTYEYDASDRLIRMQIGNEKIHYIYDSFNRRIAKVKNGQTTRYLYVGQDEIGAIDEVGQITQLRILGHGHGAEIGASIAIELKDQIFAPLHDFQGNIVSLSDLSGHVLETYRYSAFGETKIYDSHGKEITTSTLDNPWRFSSKRVDEESGLIYFGRRYYDSSNGRWITADPAGLTDGPNLYAYLHHRPLQAFDLYGLQEEPYYPLQNVDFNDKAEPKREEPRPNADAPIGFREKKRNKKDRFFFEGIKQIASLGMTCVNGIMNSLKDAYATAKALSEMADNHYVTFNYNESHGFVVDLVRCFFELHFYMQTAAVKRQQAAWNAFFNAASPDAYLFHECHSEGVIITRNALMTYPEELRKRIIVLAIAPGAYIDKKYAYQVTHYRSTRDIVPLLDFVGAFRCRDSTVVLKPHPDAPWFDHSISSPTYQEARQYQIGSYIAKFGEAA